MTLRSIVLCASLLSCSEFEGGGVAQTQDPTTRERVTWTSGTMASLVTLFDDVDMFDWVDRDAVTAFQAYGYKTGSAPGKMYELDLDPNGAPPVNQTFSGLAMRIRGSAHNGGRHVLVGQVPAPGTAGKIMTCSDAATASSPCEEPPVSGAPPLWGAVGVAPTDTFVAVVPIEHDGFMAVGRNSVWMTRRIDATSLPATHDLATWDDVTADVQALFGGTMPAFNAAARVGEAVVMVGDGGAVAVWRPKPPRLVTALPAPAWLPWVRIDLHQAGDTTDPDLLSVAADEVQNLQVVDSLAEWGNDKFLRTRGWVLVGARGGVVTRFDVRTGEILPGGAASLTTTYPPEHLERFTVTTNTCTVGDLSRAFDIYAIAVDDRTRVFAGTCGMVFTMPQRVPFNPTYVEAHPPGTVGNLVTNTIVWRGVASDNTQLLLVGGGQNSTGGGAGLVWRGVPDFISCAVQASNPTVPGIAGHTMAATECVSTEQTMPYAAFLQTVANPTQIVFTTPAATAVANGDKEPEQNVAQLATTPSSWTLTFPTVDIDPFSAWNVTTKVIPNGQAPREVDISLFPNPPIPGFNVYTALVEDFVAGRDLMTFTGAQVKRPFGPEGHVRSVITHDLFTGVHWDGAAFVPPAIPIEAEPPALGSTGATCTDTRRDQWVAHDVSTEIGGFSRLRSAAGHAYTDDYEALDEGKGWRFQSMKHYIHGLCYEAPGHAPGNWDEQCCVAGDGDDSLVTDTTLIDLYAPFEGTAYILPNPQRAMAGEPPPVASDILADNTWRDLYFYLGGSRATEAANSRSCSYFNDDEPFVTVPPAEPPQPPEPPASLLPKDRGILALVHPSHNVILVLDHAEWCWDETTPGGDDPNTPEEEPAYGHHVAAGTRLGRFSKQGVTEVAMWVNDRGNRWRLVSYFDELSDDLYKLYFEAAPGAGKFQGFGFEARPAAGDGNAVIPLAERDACPLTLMMIDTLSTSHPDHAELTPQCDTMSVPPGTNSLTCAQACPPSWLWPVNEPDPFGEVRVP